MRKNQKIRKLFRRRRVNVKSGIRDPAFTHTLTYDVNQLVSSPTTVSVISINLLNLSGAPQLITFFENFAPKAYRIKFSYTNWSGTVAFVPLNPFTATVPSAGSLSTQALREVRGAVRIQSGYNNTGVKCVYPYPGQGWQCASIGSNPIGYLAFYNDGVLPVSNWNIQVTLEVDVRFDRRQLLNTGGVVPTLTPNLSPDDDEETKSEGTQILTTKC